MSTNQPRAELGLETALSASREQRPVDRTSPDQRIGAIVEAAEEVYRQLGCGFPAAVYERAMSAELCARGVPFHGAIEEPVYYKGQRLDASSRAGFVCFSAIAVELKASAGLTDADETRLADYLRTAGREAGFLLNFGAETLEHRLLTSPAGKGKSSNPHESMEGL